MSSSTIVCGIPQDTMVETPVVPDHKIFLSPLAPITKSRVVYGVDNDDLMGLGFMRDIGMPLGIVNNPDRRHIRRIRIVWMQMKRSIRLFMTAKLGKRGGSAFAIGSFIDGVIFPKNAKLTTEGG